jgi:hypothetical protein
MPISFSNLINLQILCPIIQQSILSYLPNLMAIEPNYFFQEPLVFIIFGLVLRMFVVFS